MSPSCVGGLGCVGLPLDVGAKTNTPAPRRLIQDLTTGRLAHPQTRTERDSNAAFEDGIRENVSLPRLAVRRSGDRGLGLFAVDDIPAYSKVLEDYALLSLAQGEDIPELWQKYTLLPAEEKAQFDELGFSSHQQQKEALLTSKLQERGYDEGEAAKMVRVQSRFMANAFKEDSAKWRATLFLTAARINHSCTPNAQTHYRPAGGAKVVYAFRDISAGEEVEISYFGVTMAHADRQRRAQSWGFTCRCPACSSVDTLAGRDYERTLETLRLVLEPGRGFPRSRLVLAVRNAVDVAMRTEYPWLVAALPSLFFYLEQCLARENERKEERLAALESALKWECRITGPDSPFSYDRRRQFRRLSAELIGD